MPYIGLKTYYRVLGVDLGQKGNPCAAAMLEHLTYDAKFVGPRPKLQLPCIALRRWDLGTDYCKVVSDTLEAPADIILYEYNGVGAPVVDMARREARRIGFKGRILPCVTVSSRAAARVKLDNRGPHITVPKEDMMTTISLMQEQGLMVLPPVPESEVFLSELSTFAMRRTNRGTVVGEAAGGANDDVVMAFGIASWFMYRVVMRGAPLIAC